jgi:hypothetical protein
MKLPKSPRGIVFALTSFLLSGVSSAVTLVNSTQVTGNLFDVTDPTAEIRITILYSLEPWAADHYAAVSYGGPLPYIQAYHDPDFLGDPQSNVVGDPDHVIVRWDAYAPVYSDTPAGSTAWVTFSSNTAFVSPSPFQPTLDYFYHFSDRPGESMTLVWSNTPDPRNILAVPDGGTTVSLLALAIGGLGAGHWLRQKRGSGRGD